ncbi:MAG TPA: isocitrate/isopropylmalate family dehydrogenase [Oscillatoriaceae cyanobacterium]
MYKIAVLPGDGIGPEVIAQAVRVLKTVDRVFGLGLQFDEALIGQSALDATGRLLPPETVRVCRTSQAVLLGPVGGSRWEHPTSMQHPKQAVFNLRSWLGTYATLRPIQCYPVLRAISPLRRELQQIDMLMVYDNASGLVYGTPRGIVKGDGTLTATNTVSYSAGEIDRVARLAFTQARQRAKRVVSVDQSKTLEIGILWRDRVEAIAAEYKDVQLERIDADNFLFNLVQNPGQYDVVLTNAILGDLLSITAMGLTGSYAMHPSAYIGTDCVGLFQAAHGAADTLMGKNEANPIAAIRAASMLLENGLLLPEPAAAIERAVDEVLSQGTLPADICPQTQVPKSTEEVASAVAAAIERAHAPKPRTVSTELIPEREEARTQNPGATGG